ncbi:hypothetical protein BJ742DRAFT_687147 [Cladochytrium replicatum]|nr:hypothetical protein BJ742DRAFT_687147 [Cladochytrium replicatum]
MPTPAESELAGYQFTLTQVDEQLAKDPKNAEYTALRENITTLIDMLTEQVRQESELKTQQQHQQQIQRKKKEQLAAQSQQAQKSPPRPAWYSEGANVLAKYAADGKFYPATVLTVPEDPETEPYTITYKGYGNTESLFATEIKPDPDAPYHSAPADPKSSQSVFEKVSSSSRKRPATTDEIKSRGPSKKELEQMEKQNSWKQFALGGSKKKSATAPLAKHKSIFSTPDDPNAKVGVVGSGKPMTQFVQRGKHIFTQDDDE